MRDSPLLKLIFQLLNSLSWGHLSVYRASASFKPVGCLGNSEWASCGHTFFGGSGASVRFGSPMSKNWFSEIGPVLGLGFLFGRSEKHESVNLRTFYKACTWRMCFFPNGKCKLQNASFCSKKGPAHWYTALSTHLRTEPHFRVLGSEYGPQALWRIRFNVAGLFIKMGPKTDDFNNGFRALLLNTTSLGERNLPSLPKTRKNGVQNRNEPKASGRPCDCLCFSLLWVLHNQGLSL